MQGGDGNQALLQGITIAAWNVLVADLAATDPVVIPTTWVLVADDPFTIFAFPLPGQSDPFAATDLGWSRSPRSRG